MITTYFISSMIYLSNLTISADKFLEETPKAVIDPPIPKPICNSFLLNCAISIPERKIHISRISLSNIKSYAGILLLHFTYILKSHCIKWSVLLTYDYVLLSLGNLKLTFNPKPCTYIYVCIMQDSLDYIHMALKMWDTRN